ncbi:MAG: pyrroloquinoline quinone biosynthesis peptide chaperone PqqD [Hyphomicrobiaceae bacterium]|nr:pyrroloquinoline quinone biosynthesis peptide chaperone PqqD [Hyphomicrobiaceae bacterium]
MAESPASGATPGATPTPTRLIVAEATVVVMPRHIKLRHDAGRGVWLILAPERVFSPDPIAVEVLRMLDGQINVGGIADKLAADYHAPRDQILGDVVAMLQDLADKGVVRAAAAKS